MSSVYLLTSGTYSDYTVHSAWTDRAEADRQAQIRNAAKSRYEDEYEVEECPLDEAPLTSVDVVSGWSVRVLGEEPHGVVVGEPEGYRCLRGEDPPSYVTYTVTRGGVGHWGGYVYADSAEAAVRAAYDRAAKAKAERLGL